MAKYSNTVEYKLITSLDSSGITKLQAEILKTSNAIQQMSTKKLISDNSMRQATDALAKLQQALNKNYNSKIGMLDISGFTKDLDRAGISMDSLSKRFNLAGASGLQTFTSLMGQITKLDTGFKSVSKTVDKMWNTVGNTVRWGVVASGFQMMLNSVHNAATYVKDLDSSLTNIMMVTDYSRDAMNEYAKSANQVAKKLGSTTVDVTQGSLVYAQQGKDLPEANQLAQLSIKLANASGQTSDVTSDQITAYMNAYGLDNNIQELSKALDSWAEVANVSAADVKELATASQKAASTANTVGVNMDQLAAQIATIESVTKDAPENIGNGLKTIYARFSDISMGETLDDGVNLGQVTGALGQAGINALDSNGKMRDVGDIMEDLMDVWGQMDQTQKAAIATTLAGKYQLSRFEALMNRSDLYEQYKQSAQEGKDKGTLDVMNEKYLDSMEGKLNQLQATLEGVFNNIFESDDFYAAIDGMTSLVDLFSQLTDAVGGGDVALQAFGATALRIFSSQIGTQIGNGLQNMAVNRQKKNNSKTVQDNLNALGFQDIENGRLTDLRDSMMRSLDLSAGANDEQRESLNHVNAQLVETKQAQITAEQELIDRANALNVAYGNQLKIAGDSPIEVSHKEYVDSDGNKRTSAFREEVDTSGLQWLEREGSTLDSAAIDKLQKKYLTISSTVETFSKNLNDARGILIDSEDNATGAAFAIEKLKQAFNDTKNAVYLTKEQADAFKKALNEVEAASLHVGEPAEVSIAELIEALDTAISKSRSLGSSFQRLATDEKAAKAYVEGGSAGLQSAANKSQITRQQNSNAQRDAEGLEDQIDFSQKISSIVDMAGAVGQIAMSLESLGSLKDIWGDDSVSATEKMNSTLLNLAITLPMVGSGIKDMLPGIQKIGSGAKESLTKIAAFGNGFKTLATDVIKPTGAMKQSKNLMGDLKLAAQLSSESIGGLGKAFKGLAGPIGIAVAALAAFAAYTIGSQIDNNTKSIEAAQTKASDAKASYESVKSDSDSFKALYESYKETGQVSDEMKESADKLADSLDLQSERVLAAKGNWDLFAESVDDATKKQRESAETAQKTAIYANQKDLNGGWFTNGTLYKSSVQEDMRVNAFNMRDSLGDVSEDSNFYSQKDFDTITGLSVDAINSAKTFGQQYRLIKEAQEGITKELDRLNTEDTSNMSDAELRAHTSNLENATNWQNWAKNLSDNRLSDQYQQYSDYANMRVNDSDIQQVFENNAGNISNLTDDLQSTDSIFADFLQAQGDWSSQLEYIIQNTSDEATKNKYTAEQATYQLSQAAYDNAIGQGYSEEDANDFADKTYDKIKDSNLTSEQIITLKASIDNDYLINNIDDIIAKINSGESVDDIVFDAKIATGNLEKDYDSVSYQSNFDDKGYYNETETSDKLKSLDIDSGNFEEFKKNTATSSEALQEWNSNLQETQQTLDNQQKAVYENYKWQKQLLAQMDENDDGYSKQKEKVEEAEQAYIDNTKAVQKNKKAQENYEHTLNDIAVDAAETAKGLQKLADTSDETFGILKDSLSNKDLKSTTQYADAVREIQDALGQTLNIDGSVLDGDWIANNLDLIRQAASGDIDAIQELRNQAAQQILMNVGLDPNATGTIGADLWNLFTYAQNILPNIEVGASIDDSYFTEVLNNMLANTNLTSQQIDGILAALSGMGLDTEIQYVTKTMQVPKYHITGYQDDSESANSGIEKGTVEYESQQVQVPQIVSVKKKNIGGSYSSAVGAGYGGGKGSGGSSGGGGGGGGGGSSYTPKTKDKIDDEPDRYERVNTQLEKIGNELDRIADEQDRLTGDKLAKNMEKQIQLLQRQKELQQEKLQIEQQEAQELQNKLSSQYGVQFDSEGYMSNYYEIHQGMIDKINNLTDQYNNTSDEAGQEALEKQIEDAKKALDKFNTDYQRYDDLWAGDLEDTKKALEDIEDQIEDIRISAFKKGVEAADNIKDIQESLIEFNSLYKDIYQEDPFNSAADSVEKLGKYFDVATGSMSEYYDTMIAKMEESAKQEGVSDSYKTYAAAQIEKMKAAKAASGQGTVEEYGTGYLDMAYKNVSDIMEQIDQFNKTGKSDIFGEDSADMYEVAKDIFDQATSMAKSFAEEVKNLRDKIIDCIDKIADEAERRQNSFQAITDQLEHQLNIVQMLHGENAYDEMNTILDAQQGAYTKQISEAQQVIGYYNELLKKLPEGSEEWKAVQDKIIDAQSNLNDLVETSLEKMQQKYQNTVNKITNAWVKGALGTDIDWMSTQWELINRNADYYLDDVNKAYNIQKLQGKYLELLDGSNDLDIQKKITDQMEDQLDKLRKKTKLSEYDVQYANAQLEILQKQIALEDAQRNKNQMKLRRDTQGNYSYVYTANQDNVRGAESDLLDAKNNAYNLSKDQMKQTQDDSLSALKDAQSTINDIWTNANLTLEEKQKRTQTIIDSLKEYLAATSEQLGTSEKNIIQDFLGMCETLTEENKSDLQDVYDQIVNGNNDAFDQIDTRWQTSLTNWLQNMDAFNTSTDESMKQLVANGEEWQKNVSSIAGLVQTDFTNTTDVVNKCKDATADLSATSKGFFELLDEQSGSIVEYESKLQNMTDKISDMKNMMVAYRQQVNDLANQLTAKEQENTQLKARIDELEHPEKYGNGSGSGGGSGGADADTAYRIANSIWNTGDKGGWGDDPSRSKLITERFGYAMYEAVQALFNSGYGYHWIDLSKGYEHYDTGGYTGEWGQPDTSNGRFAMLHQKELVLNETDTANILEAVRLVRDMTENGLSNMVSSAQSQYNSVVGKLAQALNNNKQSLDQNVQITAEFPNAENFAEIRAALESLNGYAAQYAYRTK